MHLLFSQRLILIKALWWGVWPSRKFSKGPQMGRPNLLNPNRLIILRGAVLGLARSGWVVLCAYHHEYEISKHPEERDGFPDGIVYI